MVAGSCHGSAMTADGNHKLKYSNFLRLLQLSATGRKVAGSIPDGVIGIFQ
jgi:hypothetical protein